MTARLRGGRRFFEECQAITIDYKFDSGKGRCLVVGHDS